MRWLVLVVLTASCDVVFRVDGFEHADAGTSSDGISNELCPMYPGMVTDSDGDGVGDPCDPHPTKRDCLAFYSAFTDPDPLGGDWKHQNDTGIEDWTHCADGKGMALCSPRSAMVSTLYYVPPTRRIDAVLFEFEAYTVGPTNATVEVSAAADSGSADIFGRTCGIGRPSPTTMSLVAIDDHVTVEMLAADAISAVALTNAAKFRLTWRADDQVCEVRAQQGTTSSPVMTGSSPAATGAHLAMRVAHVDLNAYWVAAYSTDCP